MLNKTNRGRLRENCMRPLPLISRNDTKVQSSSRKTSAMCRSSFRPQLAWAWPHHYRGKRSEYSRTMEGSASPCVELSLRCQRTSENRREGCIHSRQATQLVSFVRRMQRVVAIDNKRAARRGGCLPFPHVQTAEGRMQWVVGIHVRRSASGLGCVSYLELVCVIRRVKRVIDRCVGGRYSEENRANPNDVSQHKLFAVHSKFSDAKD